MFLHDAMRGNGNKEGKRDKMRENQNGTERKKITTEMLSVMTKKHEILLVANYYGVARQQFYFFNIIKKLFKKLAICIFGG